MSEREILIAKYGDDTLYELERLAFSSAPCVYCAPRKHIGLISLVPCAKCRDSEDANCHNSGTVPEEGPQDADK